ncbi:protein PAT1 homolog 1 isoform X2 [Adelges cooleyi]|uniref:protein PAT1 homolog 1 isoform X2 n=1 Tax=Adelges cooleyi TaxID=133065 RepID=UPI0021806DED|nr:protein PAT1 homolog 1 isoform X2 [Adelges cooleyi]
MDGDDFIAGHQAKFEDEFEEEIYDEDKYDALNDETFGNDMSDDWEADHEQYARIDEETKKRWPDTELNGDYTDSLPSDSIFNDPIKSLPDLERELRQLSTFSQQYDIPPNLQYQNNLNFVQQNFGNVPINDCGPIRRPIPLHGFNPLSRIESAKVLPSQFSQLPPPPAEMNARKVFVPIPQYFKQNYNKYNLPTFVPHSNSIFQHLPPPPNIGNVNRHHTNMTLEQHQYHKTNDYMIEEPHDDAAGFMTLREKHWLAGIQTIQFNNSNPLEDDFYFTMYQKRHHGSSGIKSNNNSHQPDLQSKSHNAYTPLHFENSLGKVLIGSVIAPRKIIDIELNDFTPSSSPSSPLNPTTNTTRTIVAQKKSKQILLEIEQMYIPLLKIEQTYYAIRNKYQATPSVQEYINELTEILTNHLHNLVAYATIRKGKQLVHRILPHLKNPSFLWNAFFGPSICTIMMKDNEEQLLLLFLPYIRQWIFCLCLGEMNKVTECLMTNLSFVLKNIFGISVIANMIERAEEVRLTTEPEVLEQWSMFMSRVIWLSSETLVERPVIGLNKTIIEQHLTNLPFDQSITVAKINNLIQRLSFLGDTSKK